MKKLFVFFVAFTILLGGLSPLISAPADAAGLVPCGGEGQDPCNFCHIFALVNNIILFFLVPNDMNNGAAIVLILAALLFAIGGFTMLTSSGTPQKLDQGKNIIFATIIGLLIVYGSWLFIGMLLTVFDVAAWQGVGDWWQIDCKFK